MGRGPESYWGPEGFLCISFYLAGYKSQIRKIIAIFVHAQSSPCLQPTDLSAGGFDAHGSGIECGISSNKRWRRPHVREPNLNKKGDWICHTVLKTALLTRNSSAQSVRSVENPWSEFFYNDSQASGGAYFDVRKTTFVMISDYQFDQGLARCIDRQSDGCSSANAMAVFQP